MPPSSARGEFVDPNAGRVTVGELGVAWLANHAHLKPSTFRTQEIAWRTKVLPTWGNRRIGQVLHSDLQAWLTRLGAGGTVSATTVRRAHGVLAAILDVAVKDRRISVNPARDVKLPRKGKKARVYLTSGQVELLAHFATHGTLVTFLACTGLRWGEATGVRPHSTCSAVASLCARTPSTSAG